MKSMNILRRSYRLFATFKTIGMLFRITRNVWSDFFRQLKKIWVKGQPKGQKEFISYSDALKARDEAKLTLDNLLEIRRQRERTKEGWS